ncbi:unnamed protein product [Prunus armeniaca]
MEWWRHCVMMATHCTITRNLTRTISMGYNYYKLMKEVVQMGKYVLGTREIDMYLEHMSPKDCAQKMKRLYRLYEGKPNRGVVIKEIEEEHVCQQYFIQKNKNYNDSDEDNGVEGDGHEDGDSEVEGGEVEGKDGEVEGEHIATEDGDEDEIDSDFVDNDYSLDEDENENIGIGDDVYDPLAATTKIGHRE